MSSMKMSDLVAQTILEMLDDHNGNAEIQRNELATTLGCVPSQIKSKSKKVKYEPLNPFILN